MKTFKSIISISAFACLVAGCGKKKVGEEVAPAPSASPTPQTVDKTVERVLTNWLTADKCADRVQYALSPEKNRAAINERYADKKSCKTAFEAIDATDCLSPTDGRCSAKVTFGKRKNAFGREYDDVNWYCIALDGMPKIDWRCSVGYNPTPLKTFKATYEIGKSARFRLLAEISDYYNYEYSHAKAKVYSLALKDDDNESIAGYVDKDSDLGKNLFDSLKDGKSHAVVLELTYRKGSQSASIVTITNMFGHKWREFPEELQ